MGKARGKLSGAALAEFNAKHPRGAGGRFGTKGGAAAALRATARPSIADPPETKRVFGGIESITITDPIAQNRGTDVENRQRRRAERERRVNELTAQIAAATTPAERQRLTQERADLVAAIQQGGVKPDTFKPRKARDLLNGSGSKHLDDDAVKGESAIAPRSGGKQQNISAADLPAVLAEIDALVANPKTERDRDRVKNLLGRMTVPQIKQVADKHHRGILVGANKDERIRRLADSIVGTKLDSSAIQSGWQSDSRMDAIASIVANPKQGDQERLASWLNSLKASELPDVARRHNVRLLGGTKSEKIENLVDSLVQSKLNSVAIRESVRDALNVGGDSGRAFGGGTLAAKPRKARDALNAGSGRISVADLPAALTEIDAMVANPKPADRDRMNDLLGRMTIAQLDEVAGRHNSRLDGTASTKALKATRLTEHLIGHKLNSDALQRVDVSMKGADALMGIDRTPDRPKKSARAALSGKQPVNIHAVTADLEKLRANPKPGDREKVAAILEPLGHKELDQLAQDNDRKFTGTLAQKREQLAEMYVGRRLSSDAIFALRDRPLPASTPGQARAALGGGQAAESPAPAILELADDPVEAAVLNAYLQLREEPRAWMALTDLRAMLPSNLSKAQVDAALVRLARKRGVSLVPPTNQKLLRPEDRAAMVRSGNENKLLFSVDTF